MLNIELEERAKKQGDNSPKVLPPEEPWERLMRPLTESVSRTKQELVAMVSADPQPPKPAPPSAPPEPPSAPARSAGGE
jgi:hypothetical protein